MPFPLPAEIDPPQISVCVPVPDDPDHKRAFLAQLHRLSWSRMWGADGYTDDSAAAARVWFAIYIQVAEALDMGEECGGMDCCGDLLNAIQTSTAALQNALRAAAYDGSPTSVNPNAPSYTFSQATAGDVTDHADRLTALCLAVRQYVYNRVLFAIYAKAAASGVAVVAGVLLIVLGGPLAAIIGAAAYAVGLLALEDLQNAANDQEALDELICQLFEMLQGVPISQDNFEAALLALTASTANESIILDCLHWNPDMTANYLYFLDLLGAGMAQAEAGAVDDCCDDLTCDWDFALGGHGFTITHGTRVPGVGIKNTTLGVGYEMRAGQNFGETLPCAEGDDIYYRITYSYSGGGGSAANFQWGLYRTDDVLQLGALGSLTNGVNQQLVGIWTAGGGPPFRGWWGRKWNSGLNDFTLHRVELSDTAF